MVKGIKKYLTAEGFGFTLFAQSPVERGIFPRGGFPEVSKGVRRGFLSFFFAHFMTYAHQGLYASFQLPKRIG